MRDDRRAQVSQLAKRKQASSSAPDAFGRISCRRSQDTGTSGPVPNRSAGRRHRLHSSSHRRCRTWFRKCRHTCSRRGFHRRSIDSRSAAHRRRPALQVKEAKNCRRLAQLQVGRLGSETEPSPSFWPWSCARHWPNDHYSLRAARHRRAPKRSQERQPQRQPVICSRSSRSRAEIVKRQYRPAH